MVLAGLLESIDRMSHSPAVGLLASPLRNWCGLNRNGSAGDWLSMGSIDHEFPRWLTRALQGENRSKIPVSRLSSIPDPAQNRHSRDILRALD